MILVVVIGSWLGIVAIAVAIDAGTAYLAERTPKPVKDELEVKKGIAAYRNRKRIESGLVMISQREVRVDRPRGAHRRLQVS